MAARIVWLALLLGLGNGCSSPAEDPTGGAGSAGLANSGGASGDSGSSSGGGAIAGAAMGGNAAGGEMAGSGGGAGSSSGPLTVRNLAMLAVGNQWTYAVTGDGFDCPTGTQTTKVESQETVQGHDAYQVRDFCSHDKLIAYSYDADSLLQQFGEEWLKAMTSPIEDGASWTFAPGTTITWHTVPSITVPAGTFTNCVNRTVSDTSTSEATFCPGVGQVKRVSDSFAAVLGSYDVH
jgi:hypothetical protein